MLLGHCDRLRPRRRCIAPNPCPGCCRQKCRQLSRRSSNQNVRRWLRRFTVRRQCREFCRGRAQPGTIHKSVSWPALPLRRLIVARQERPFSRAEFTRERLRTIRLRPNHPNPNAQPNRQQRYSANRPDRGRTQTTLATGGLRLPDLCLLDPLQPYKEWRRNTPTIWD